MSNLRKAGLATMAVGSLFASAALPTAFADIGRSENAGVIYGQEAAYCDAQAVAVLKTDSLSGDTLPGATFTLTNTSNQLLGVLAYDADPTVDSDNDPATPTALQLDRIKWQEKFNSEINLSFTNTDIGGAWAVASVKMNAGQAQSPSVGSDTELTEFVYDSNIVHLPADIRGVDDASQNIAMASWARMAAQDDDPATTADETTVTVTQFGNSVKERLDAIGAVLYSDYDAATGIGTNIRNELTGTGSENVVAAAFQKAADQWTLFKNAVVASGWNVAVNGSTVTIVDYSITPQSVVDATDLTTLARGPQDWIAFNIAYTAMIAKDAFAFGLVPPTYDVIANAIGNDALAAAATAANGVVGDSGANNVTAGGNMTGQLTGSDGGLYYGIFGRDLTTGGAGKMDKTCAVQKVSFTETEAPAGYRVDENNAIAVGMSNVEDALARIEFTSTPVSVPVDPDKPTLPQFESGL